jgi:hypothetical protein
MGNMWGIHCRILLDDLKERRGYPPLKEEALDYTIMESSLWKRLWTCHKTAYWMNEWTWREQVSSPLAGWMYVMWHLFENICCKNWCEHRVVMPYAAQQSELCLTAPW